MSFEKREKKPIRPVKTEEELDNKIRIRRKLQSVILYGILAGASVAGLLYLTHIRSKSEVILRPAVTALQEIEEGTLIHKKDVDAYFTVREINQDYGYEGIVGDLGYLLETEGILITSHLSPNEPLTASDFKDDGDMRKRYENAVVKGISVSRFSNAVCGILRRGDVIDLYATDSATGENRCILHDVYVDNAFDSAGAKLPPENKESVATALSVLLTPEQVDVLGKYETNKELSFVKTRDVL